MPHLAKLRNGKADYEPKDDKITLSEWLKYGVRRVPALADEVLSGGVRVVSTTGRSLHSGPSTPRAGRHRVVQQPELFEFSKRADSVVIQEND